MIYHTNIQQLAWNKILQVWIEGYDEYQHDTKSLDMNFVEGFLEGLTTMTSVERSSLETLVLQTVDEPSNFPFNMNLFECSPYESVDNTHQMPSERVSYYLNQILAVYLLFNTLYDSPVMSVHIQDICLIPTSGYIIFPKRFGKYRRGMTTLSHPDPGLVLKLIHVLKDMKTLPIETQWYIHDEMLGTPALFESNKTCLLSRYAYWDRLYHWWSMGGDVRSKGCIKYNLV